MLYAARCCGDVSCKLPLRMDDVARKCREFLDAVLDAAAALAGAGMLGKSIWTFLNGPGHSPQMP